MAEEIAVKNGRISNFKRLMALSLPTSKSRDTKTRINVNNWARSSLDIDFQLLRARDLDLGSGHTAYRHASLMDLYLHAKFH